MDRQSTHLTEFICQSVLMLCAFAVVIEAVARITNGGFGAVDISAVSGTAAAQFLARLS